MQRKTHIYLKVLFGFIILAFMTMKAEILHASPLKFEINESVSGDQMINHILKITNTWDIPLKGTVIIDVPAGIRSLSQAERSINVMPGDSVFIPFRFLLTKNLESGNKKISYTLLNEELEELIKDEVTVEIEPRRRLTLTTDNAPVLLTNPGDSVRITATVNNIGNITEEVTLVFNVPNLQNKNPFTEMTAILAPGEQHEFTYNFIPSDNLLKLAQFQVQTTAMRGKEKNIFDSKKIMVRSVVSQHNYNSFIPDHVLLQGEGTPDNAVRMSYRQYNNSSSMLQIQGGSFLDIPAGYIYLKGNIYKYNTQQVPVITNTSLTYKLFENEFILGSVSELAEMPLFGRGVKTTLSNQEKNKRITFGAIDQNYNLLGSQPWFTDYYSFYVKGELGRNNDRVRTGTTYIYQRNPYEKASYHVSSLEWNFSFGRNWNIGLKTHGSMGNYESFPEESKYSGAAEMRYRGMLFSDLTLNGTAYYSDHYFPGNRKGTLSVSHNMSWKVSRETYVSASYSYNRAEPRSYTYDFNYLSQNSYGSLSVSLPQMQSLSSSLYYNHQNENSPSYSRLILSEDGSQNLEMASNRLGWQWRWQNPDVKYSFFGSIEGGIYNNPMERNLIGQGKGTLSYSYRWLSAELSYQYGAYYLYEHVMAQLENKIFNRLAVSAVVNHRFSRKFALSSGVNFVKDTYQGIVPSINTNMQYYPRGNVSLFLNGYWYKYPFFNSHIMSTEVGFRYHFKRLEPLKGRKSKVVAKVYYDHNNNGRFDNGDEAATGYLIDIDQKTFISGNNGKMLYKSVPFGEYTIRPVQSGKWTFDQKKLAVNSFKTEVEIPLRQSGTLRGSIRYVAGEHSVEIVPQYEGIRIIITDADSKLHQTVITDENGSFVAFLPAGKYTIELDNKTTMELTECKEPIRTLEIEAGKVSKPAPFIIEVKERKVNVRRFVAQPEL